MQQIEVAAKGQQSDEEKSYFAKRVKDIMRNMEKALKSANPYARKNPKGFIGDLFMITPGGNFSAQLIKDKAFLALAAKLKAKHQVDVLAAYKRSISLGKDRDKAAANKGKKIDELKAAIEKLKNSKPVQQYLEAVRLLKKVRNG